MHLSGHTDPEEFVELTEPQNSCLQASSAIGANLGQPYDIVPSMTAWAGQ